MIKFIENIGDYYSQHFFTDDFAKKVFDKAGYVTQKKDSDGVKTANHLSEINARITPLRAKYDKFKNDLLSLKREKDKVKRTHDFHYEVLNALGYINGTPEYNQPVYLNENTFAYKALEQFKIQKIHYGIIVDEYGVTQGMVTMDDVIDALFGDVTEQGQEEYEIVERNENSWLVDGQYSAIEFFKYLDLSLGENTNDNYTTVAGLIIYLHNSLPNVGDKVKLQNYELEIIDKDGQRIDKVLVTKTEN